MARKVGQIIRRETGTWLVRVYSGRDPETKRRKYLNQTIHGGLRDAQAHLNKMLSERDLGRKLDSSKQTLNQHLDYWLELCAKPRLRAKSLKDYEGLLRRYVRPRLGPKALASISSLDIQALYRDLLVRNLSARSIRYTHAVLRSALKQAMRWNFILANPADSVDLPRQERPQIEVLTVEQARIFVKALAGHQYSDLFAIALTTGMRPSEYLGLTWNDLDLERGTASVSHTLEWRKGGWQFSFSSVAIEIGVWRRSFAAFRSAPPANSSLTISTGQRDATALCRGVQPMAPVPPASRAVFTLTPAANSSLAISSRPLVGLPSSVASRALTPLASVALRLTLASIRILTISACPPAAAVIRG
jgi:hypothetical protein